MTLELTTDKVAKLKSLFCAANVILFAEMPPLYAILLQLLGLIDCKIINIFFSELVFETLLKVHNSTVTIKMTSLITSYEVENTD